MKQRYFIREPALTDLEETWLYTPSELDLEQADGYIHAILTRLNWLADPGYVCFPEGRHLIFCVMTEGTVNVIGIQPEYGYRSSFRRVKARAATSVIS